MKLKYNNKEIKLIPCESFFSRFMGFMGKKRIDYALLFDRCNSIHTFFMKCPIDVLMCDCDNRILYYYPNLDKNRIILPKSKVVKVLELPALFFDVKINERIEIDNED